MRLQRSTRDTVEPSARPGIALMALGTFAFVVIIGIVAALYSFDARLATSEQAVGVDRIAVAPDAYYGKTVTIAGDIADIYGPRMFTLAEDSVSDRADLLVLLKEPMPRAPESLGDATVIVTGTVRAFTRAELARDYEWIDESWFADRDLSAAEQLPVIVADSAAIG